jgi:hypothetical protein
LIGPGSHDFKYYAGYGTPPSPFDYFEFTVVNVGGSAGALSAITVADDLPARGGPAFTDYGKGTCQKGASIPVNGTCTVMVQYRYIGTVSPTGHLTVTGAGRSASAVLRAPTPVATR